MRILLSSTSLCREHNSHSVKDNFLDAARFINACACLLIFNLSHMLYFLLENITIPAPFTTQALSIIYHTIWAERCALGTGEI